MQGGINIDKSASERLISWHNGVNIFTKNPIVGVGFNNYRDALRQENALKLYSADGGNAGAGVDSSFLFILATTGILGFLSFLSFWVLTLYNLIRDYKKKRELISLVFISIILGFSINSQFINSLFYPPIMFLVYLLVGCYYGQRLKFIS